MGNFLTKDAVADVELITQHAANLQATFVEAFASAEVQIQDFVAARATLLAAQGADADDTAKITALITAIGTQLDNSTKTWSVIEQTVLKTMLDLITLPDAV